MTRNLNDEIYFAIEDMFKNGDASIQCSFRFGDYYISLTWSEDEYGEYYINFNLTDKVDIFNEVFGELLYNECIFITDMDKGLPFLNTWIKQCYEILLDKELKNDYDYQTKNKDTLEDIHDSLFSEYDNDEYECCYNDTIHDFSDEIMNSGQIGEITSYFYKSFFNDNYSNLYDLFFELSEDIKKDIAKDYLISFDQDNFRIPQCCNGHWYIKKR